MADYLESYAAHFELPVRSGVEVERLEKVDGRFVISSGEELYESENVIVATGAHNIPKTPAFAAELDPRIVQLHSAAYRNPSQLQDGDVLLVGAGNSGAELAVEVCQMHRVLLSGPKLSEIPVKHGTLPFRPGFRVFRFLGHRVISRGNPIGRKIGPKLLQEADPLIRTKSKELAGAGVERVPRVTGVENGRPVLEDRRVLDVANVIWCTGFRTDFGWIDLPVFDEAGQPEHVRGVVESEPGLYFLGLVFQYSFSSDVLPGRGRDASYIAKHIADQRTRATKAPSRALVTA
jgi:putative flavoprotein involved in K+ transport